MTPICLGMNQSQRRITNRPGFLQPHQGPRLLDYLFYLYLASEAQQRNLCRGKLPQIRSSRPDPPTLVALMAVLKRLHTTVPPRVHRRSPCHQKPEEVLTLVAMLLFISQQRQEREPSLPPAPPLLYTPLQRQMVYSKASVQRTPLKQQKVVSVQPLLHSPVQRQKVVKASLHSAPPQPHPGLAPATRVAQRHLHPSSGPR